MKKIETLLKKARPIGFDLQAPMKIETETIYVGLGAEGTVVYLSSEEPEEQAPAVYDLDGLYLSPGWIDLHTHIYDGVSNIALSPAEAGPARGVVLPVDAGSAGEANFSGFRKHIVNNFQFPIKAFLNIGSIGCTAANIVSELGDLNHVNLEGTIDCVERNKDIVKGIKVRASRVIVNQWAQDAVRLAKKVAQIVDLPLVVHVGEPPIFIQELVDLISSGDLITHCYNSKWGSDLKDDLEVKQAYQKAVEKGILLDVGHGSASFSYQTAQEGIKHGLLPFSISTDLHKSNFKGPVWDLATTMSKFLDLGLEMERVIEMVTKNPAEFLRIPAWTELGLGKTAYFTAFGLKDGTFPVEDAFARSDVTVSARGDRHRYNLSKFIQPRYVFCEEKVITAQSGYLTSLGI